MGLFRRFTDWARSLSGRRSTAAGCREVSDQTFNRVLEQTFNSAIRDPLIRNLARNTGGAIGETEAKTALAGVLEGRGNIIAPRGRSRPAIIASLILLNCVAMRNRAGLTGDRARKFWLVYKGTAQPCPWIGGKGINTVSFVGESIKAIKLDRKTILHAQPGGIRTELKEADIVVVASNLFSATADGAQEKGASADTEVLQYLASELEHSPALFTLNMTEGERRDLSLALRQSAFRAKMARPPGERPETKPLDTDRVLDQVVGEGERNKGDEGEGEEEDKEDKEDEEEGTCLQIVLRRSEVSYDDSMTVADSLWQAFKKARFGDVVGGSKGADTCDIDVWVPNVEKGLEVIRATLRGLGCPPTTEIHRDKPEHVVYRLSEPTEVPSARTSARSGTPKEREYIRGLDFPCPSVQSGEAWAATLCRQLIEKHGRVLRVDVPTLRPEAAFADGTVCVFEDYGIGYHGTGSHSFAAFLQEAGYSVTADDVAVMHPPVHLMLQGPAAGFRRRTTRKCGSQRFIDNGDGTVADTTTGLQWQKEDDNVRRDYRQAEAYVKHLRLGGYEDWRLPDKDELKALAALAPKVLKRTFAALKSERYWARTQPKDLAWAQQPDKIAYVVDFASDSANYGQEVTYFRSYEYYVRAVRGLSHAPLKTGAARIA